jgi:hypothetical protein
MWPRTTFLHAHALHRIGCTRKEILVYPYIVGMISLSRVNESPFGVDGTALPPAIKAKVPKNTNRAMQQAPASFSAQNMPISRPAALQLMAL